jgi:hypothetical protein
MKEQEVDRNGRMQEEEVHHYDIMKEGEVDRTGRMQEEEAHHYDRMKEEEVDRNGRMQEEQLDRNGRVQEEEWVLVAGYRKRNRTLLRQDVEMAPGGAIPPDTDHILL